MASAFFRHRKKKITLFFHESQWRPSHQGNPDRKKGRGASWEQYAEVNTLPSVCYIMAAAAQNYHPHYIEWARNKKAKAAYEPFCDNTRSAL